MHSPKRASMRLNGCVSLSFSRSCQDLQGTAVEKKCPQSLELGKLTAWCHGLDRVSQKEILKCYPQYLGVWPSLETGCLQMQSRSQDFMRVSPDSVTGALH